MYPFRIVFLLFFLPWIHSCKQSNSGGAEHIKGIESSPLYLEVMAIHDAVMPEMTTLHDLKTRLKQVETPQTRDRILAEISRIDKADEAMMDWMAKFDVPAEEEAANQYLAAEKVKIQVVSDSTYQVISDVRKFLKTNSPSQK